MVIHGTLNQMTEPTAEEIKSHRETMELTDKVLKKPYRLYTDEEVVKFITEPLSDTGGSLLAHSRVLETMLKAYKGDMK